MRRGGLLLLGLLLIAACRPPAPCAAEEGACLALRIEGDVGPVDALQLDFSGALQRSHRIWFPQSVRALPVLVGILLPASLQGTLLLHATALLQDEPVGGGVGAVHLFPDEHAAMTLTLDRRLVPMRPPPVQGCPAGTFCPEAAPTAATLRGLWGTDVGDLWAVGDEATVLRRTPTGWRVLSGVPTRAALRAVDGQGPSSVFLSGHGGTVLRWDGADLALLPRPSMNALHGVWASPSGAVFVVGDRGELQRRDGTTWSSLGGSGSVLLGVWGSAANDAWIVGEGGTILRYDGAAWTPSISGTTTTLRGLWGSGPRDVWAVGDSGTILHWDGTAWSPASSGVQGTLRAVRGGGPRDVWAVGDSGTILHWDGSRWRPQPSGTSADLLAVWVGGGHILAVGADGTILHRRP
ncbi:MAG: hypothetical protein NZ890_06620 [Myxococcota bacterium]|nr:hypothetical protein [Myxococcota bacterium]